MDCIEAEERFAPVEVEDFGIQDTIQSSDNFQKFIYELFDKNGIINDLRAYLRGHIVNVLKSAETGDLPVCQKNFAQRLELPFQALNILIVEYLLTMEFNYTLSVYISEIPLANMVFEFTKKLLNSETESKVSNLRFENADVWSILNCIGLKCSSEEALKIVEMYKNEKRPLLFCILKCVSLYQKEEVLISDQSSVQSSDNLDEKAEEPCKQSHKCKHFVFCKACQYRVARLKEKYKRKKANIEKNAKTENIKRVSVETFMSNVSVLEQTLIDEMFQELKTVYETEIEMVKEEQQKNLKHSIASHAIQMQSYKEKMEQSFKAREAELTQAVQQKKRFLWGLARSLREQHEHLTKAMKSVREQSDRLTHKESSFKTQLKEAEEVLKKRGEDMRKQISDELVILGDHLETMKKERDIIQEQRKEMEDVKNTNIQDKDLKENYDILKNELIILRKYIENMKVEPKCLIEKGTITDFGVKFYMNNEIRHNIGQVVNDLKKQKNVNFSQSNFDEINNVSGRPSTISSEGDIDAGETRDHYRMDIRDGDTKSRTRHYRGNRDIEPWDHLGPGDMRGLDVEVLRQENNRLKSFARQQRDYIQALFNEKDRLQRALSLHSRPRTAPCRPNIPENRVNLSPSAMFSRGLAEDDRRVVSDSWRPRVVPDDITQQGNTRESLENSSGIRPERDVVYQQHSALPPRTNYTPVSEGKIREKSPKSMLREAKEKLRNSAIKQTPQVEKTREKSPTATLKEAKLRLRKLEIEAEAVEKSYQDFRRRQHELREERESLNQGRCEMDGEVDKLDLRSYGKFEKKTYKNDPSSYINESPETMKKDFDKYLKEYNTKFDLNRLRFNNKNSVLENVKPIPTSFGDKKDVNYLETPLLEFRKLYQVERYRKNKLNKNYNAEVSDLEISKSENSRRSKNKNEDEILISNDSNKNCITKGIDETKSMKYDSGKSSKSKCPDLKKESNKSENDTTESVKQDTIKTSPKANFSNEPKQSIINNIITISPKPKYHELKKPLLNNKNISSKLHDKISESQAESKNSPKNTNVINNEPTDLNNKDIKSQNNEIIYKEIEKESEDKNNLLVVEVENACKNIIVPEKNQEFLVVIESSVDNGDVEDVEADQKYPISIIVSPKNKGGEKDFETLTEKSKSTESQNDNFNAIFDDKKELSNVDIRIKNSKELVESISEVEKDLDEYLDDLSADVDNYNNISENGNISPISLLKSSEDEKFWDS